MSSSVRTRSVTLSDRKAIPNSLPVLPKDDVNVRVEGKPDESTVDSEILNEVVGNIATPTEVVVALDDHQSVRSSHKIRSHTSRVAKSNKTKSNLDRDSQMSVASNRSHHSSRSYVSLSDSMKQHVLVLKKLELAAQFEEKKLEAQIEDKKLAAQENARVLDARREETRLTIEAQKLERSQAIAAQTREKELQAETRKLELQAQANTELMNFNMRKLEEEAQVRLSLEKQRAETNVANIAIKNVQHDELPESKVDDPLIRDKIVNSSPSSGLEERAHHVMYKPNISEVRQSFDCSERVNVQAEANKCPVSTKTSCHLSKQENKSSSECVVTGESFNFSRQWLPLQGPNDDLDSHLINFERMMHTRRVPIKHWVVMVLPTLNSKSQAIHARMSISECSEYHLLKQALVESFDLGPDEYKRKFRNEARQHDESFRDFGVRLEHLYNKWRQGKSRGETIECRCGIAEDEMLEQYYTMIPRDLKILVKDKSPRTIKEACKVSDELDRARDRVFSRMNIVTPQIYKHYEMPKRSFNNSNVNHFSSYNDSQHVNRPPMRANFNSGPRFQVPHYRSSSSFAFNERKPYNGPSNHRADNQRSFTPQRQGYKPAERAYCSIHNAAIGHTAEQCWQNPKYKNSNTNRSIQPANKVSAFVNQVNSRIPNPVHGEFSEVASVNGKQIHYIRDSGSSVSLISPSVIPNFKPSGKNISITSVFGNTETIPVAVVHLKCRYGEIDWPVGVVNNLPVEMIIGNDLDSSLGQQFRDQCFVVTRSKAKLLDSIAEEVETKADALLENTSTVVEAPSQLPTIESRSTIDLNKVPEALSESTSVNNDVDYLILGDTSCQQFALDQANDETLAPLLRKVDTPIPNKVNNRFSSIIKKDKRNVYYRYTTQSRASQLGDTVKLKQLLVPLKYRRALLKIAHDDHLSSHQGSKRTILRVIAKFFWSGVYRDIEEYINTCKECQAIGKSNKKNKAPMILTPIVDRPFKRMAMDIVGPLETSRKGNRFILTVIDMHSRYPHAVAMRSVETKKVAEELLKIFSNIGICEELLSDLGTNFTSQLMKDFCQLLNIKQLHSSAYRPQTNGTVERWNGSLKVMLQTGLVHKEKNLWDTLLSSILFAYRSVPQKATGFSPFEMIYGFPIRTPLDLIREKWSGKEKGNEEISVVDFIQNMRSNLKIISSIAVASEQKVKLKTKEWYDAKAREISYKVGDHVFVLLPIKTNKLESSWQGPYEIVQRQGPVDYIVNFKDRNKAHRLVHVNMLRQYHERVVLFSASEQIDDEEVASFPENVTSELSLDTLKLDDRITPQMKTSLFQILDKYRLVFTDIPGQTHLIEHEIRLTSEQPFKCALYRVPNSLEPVMKKEIETALQLGLIERCSPNINPSPYASPCLLVPKKGQTKFRLVIDFRRLNALSIVDPYPVHHIPSLLDKISGATYLTALDLSRGYNQVPMKEGDKGKTAFVNFMGQFQCRFMPFGLVNAGSTFQRVMSAILYDCYEYSFSYVDDVCIFSSSWEEHLIHLNDVVGRIQKAGMTINPAKCQIAQAKILYLGYVVGSGCKQVDPAKLEIVDKIMMPRSKTQIRAFIGFTSYYRSCIPAFSEIAKPLTDLLAKKSPDLCPIEDVHIQAFENLKRAMIDAPILIAPDSSKSFVLQTDASDYAMGAVLGQYDDNKVLRPVAFLSKKFTATERRYSTSERECLAIVVALHRFKIYLVNSTFEIQTDHRPLICMNSQCFVNDRLTRWSLLLQSFKYSITYIKGSDNIVSDYMSRINYSDKSEQHVNEINDNVIDEARISFYVNDVRNEPSLAHWFKNDLREVWGSRSYTTIEGGDSVRDSLTTMIAFTDVPKHGHNHYSEGQTDCLAFAEGEGHRGDSILLPTTCEGSDVSEVLPDNIRVSVCDLESEGNEFPFATMPLVI